MLKMYTMPRLEIYFLLFYCLLFTLAILVGMKGSFISILYMITTCA
jgi:hypothetical protein